jgi:hypothetical protein
LLRAFAPARARSGRPLVSLLVRALPSMTGCGMKPPHGHVRVLVVGAAVLALVRPLDLAHSCGLC